MFMEEHDNRVLNANSMGLGKTFETLLSIKRNLSKKDTVIVVCPKTIKETWRRQAIQHINRLATVLNGTRPPKKVVNRLKKGGIYVVNWDILTHWVKYLKRLKPTMVVGDEIQRIKNPASKRTRAFKELCKRVPMVHALGGTGGLENRPIELFPVLNILWPDQFPSYRMYGRRYCGAVFKPWGWEYKGATRTKELRKRLIDLGMIRRRKEDVLKDLPAVQETVVPIEMRPADMKEYREAERDLIAWLRRTNPKAASSARKAERLVRFNHLKGLIAQLKVKYVVEWIDTFLDEGDDKLVAFGWHKAAVRGLHEHYDGRSVMVNGSVVGDKRQTAIDAFNNLRNKKVFFGNIKAAGEGWSCTSSSTVMFFEFGWTPSEHNQCKDRVRGIGRGTGKKVQVYYLTALGTLEEDLIKLIQRKQKVLDAVLDGKRTPGGFNVQDELERLLMRKGRK